MKAPTQRTHRTQRNHPSILSKLMSLLQAPEQTACLPAAAALAGCVLCVCVSGNLSITDLPAGSIILNGNSLNSPARLSAPPCSCSSGWRSAAGLDGRAPTPKHMGPWCAPQSVLAAHWVLAGRAAVWHLLLMAESGTLAHAYPLGGEMPKCSLVYHLNHGATSVFIRHTAITQKEEEQTA